MYLSPCPTKSIEDLRGRTTNVGTSVNIFGGSAGVEENKFGAYSGQTVSAGGKITFPAEFHYTESYTLVLKF